MGLPGLFLVLAFSCRSQPIWSQKSCADVIMPMTLSRLLVLSTNSRTCRSDLLLTIVRYCGLSEDLPDHCKSALNILYNVVRAMQPHESILAVLRDDKVGVRVCKTCRRALNLPFIFI